MGVDCHARKRANRRRIGLIEEDDDDRALATRPGRIYLLQNISAHQSAKRTIDHVEGEGKARVNK